MKLNTTTLNREFDAHRYILSSVSNSLLFRFKKDLEIKKVRVVLLLPDLAFATFSLGLSSGALNPMKTNGKQ
jgi:hypothetical protein